MSRRKLRIHFFKMVFMLAFTEDEREQNEKVELYLKDPEPDDEDEMEETMAEEEQFYLSCRMDKLKKLLPEIDKTLNEASRGWKTSRMSKVDLAILRVGVYELVYDEAIPEGVAINEAVELAKIYGDKDSASFVNGILGSVARKTEKS